MLAGPQERLNSWKEISEFLGCHEKTARRWEKLRALPVRRVPGGGKSSVYAYREELESWLKGNPVDESAVLSPAIPKDSTSKPDSRRRNLYCMAFAAALILLATAGMLFRSNWNRPSLRLAGDPEVLSPSIGAKLPPLMMDRRNVYFQESDNGRFRMMQISLAGKSVGPLAISLENPDPGIVAPDGSAMLLRSVRGSKDGDEPLYVQPLPSGIPRRLGDVMAYDSAWTPNRKHIIFGKLNSVYEATADGAATRKLFDVPGRAYHFRWSSKGSLRFTVYDSRRLSYRIWQMASRDSQPLPISFGLDEVSQQCCGEWSGDGTFFVFQVRVNGFWQVFAHAENTGFFGRGDRSAVQLTSGMVDSRSPLPTPDGSRLLVLSQSEKSEVVRYDRIARRWLPLLEGVPAATATFSRDGQWLAYTRMPDFTLWRCRMPGCREAVQLTFAPLRVTMPRWSPDATRIACMTRTFGGKWRAAIIPAAGGVPAQLIDSEDAEADPTWSPDGEQLAFASVPGLNSGAGQPIHILDLRTKKEHAVAGSSGFNTPVWSPDGRFLAAVQSGSLNLAIYEFSTERWRKLPATRGGYLNWSADGKRLYFLSLADSREVMALDVSSLRQYPMAGFSEIRQPSFAFGEWVGLGPSDTLLALRDLSTEEIISWRFDRR